jgi:pilus assembly protein CpaC
VVITARLAKPLAPHEVPTLPTEYELNDPNDFELFLLGSEGRGAPPAAAGVPARSQSAGDVRRAGVGRRGPAGEIGFIR